MKKLFFYLISIISSESNHITRTNYFLYQDDSVLELNSYKFSTLYYNEMLGDLGLPSHYQDIFDQFESHILKETNNNKQPTNKQS